MISENENYKHCFEKIRPQVEELFKDAATKVINNIYDDYLPWVQVDTMSNVNNIANSIVESLLAGTIPNYRVTDLILSDRWLLIRNKIYTEHKEEIIRTIQRDFEKEITLLKEEITSLRDRISSHVINY